MSSHGKLLNLTLKIWRQKSRTEKGFIETHEMKGVSTEISFLEMLDTLNDQLERSGNAPVVFDHDCREGICGMCSLYINGQPHGPAKATTTCQLHMREFKDGETIFIEPWRSAAFPVVRDLMLIAPLSIALFRQVVILQSKLAQLPMPTRLRFQKRMQTSQWTRQRVSVAVLV